MAKSGTHKGWLYSHNNGILAAVYIGAKSGATALATNTALDGVLLGTPVTPALAVDTIVLSGLVASGDFLLALNNGGNSQAWLWVDSSAGTMRLYGAGTPVVETASTYAQILDDILLGIGTGNTARLSYDTTDANANALLLQLPAGGAVDVPVVAVGQSIESVDLGLFNGIVNPTVAIFGVGAVATGVDLRFYKARGTIAAPTVVTTGDDLGTIRAYGAVAAGEYVEAAEIRFDMAGTIATTRGPGTITFLTATDAAPSVLTQALLISAAQLVTAASLTSTGAFTASSTSALNGNVTVADDILLGIGTGNVARFSWDTTDANANALLLQMPAGGAVDVPVLIIGQAIESFDFGLYNGEVNPRVAIFSTGAVATSSAIEFRKSRGTVAAPTVVTSADDLGSLDFYGAVAAGEYVEAARILVEMTGTIATTRGPGVMTFQTATDAAPSVLTTALTISAAQLCTFAAGIQGNTRVDVGVTGTTTGIVAIDGATSGTVSVTVAAAAGTWTYTLPATAGEAGDVQVTDGAGVASWVSGMRSVDVQVTNAQMLALLGTDIVLVAAPGANRAIVVHAVYMFFDVTTTAYTLGTAALAIGYGGDGADIAVITEAGWLDQTSDAGRWYQIGAAAATPDIITPVANQTVVLRATTADMTGGNTANTLSVRVYYSVVDYVAFT